MGPYFSVTDLDYADDVDMLAESVAEAQAMINDMAVKELSTGLQISLPKTKSMRTDGMDETPVALNGNQIEDVQLFKYHGLMVNLAGKSSEEIQSRISSDWSFFLQLRKHGSRAKYRHAPSSEFMKLWFSLSFSMDVKRDHLKQPKR